MVPTRITLAPYSTRRPLEILLLACEVHFKVLFVDQALGGVITS